LNKKIERYIITGAVNNCELHADGFKALEYLTDYYGAELIVMPIYYNPYHLTHEEIKFDERVEPYLLKDSATINNVSLLTTINISPTASKPLNGLGSMEDNNHTIVAHTRLHMNHLPTGIKGSVKQLLTTGCITNANYTQSKVGQKANFHHSHGCVIVEVSKKETILRQVSIAEDGSIYDLDIVSTPTHGVTSGNKVEAIVYGDIHELFLSDAVRDKGFFGKGSLMEYLKPNTVVLHDLLDTMTVSHHHENAPFIKYRVANGGVTVIDEIKSAIKFVDDIIKLGAYPIVVSSNHNSHLTQWLERTSWKSYPQHAKDILQMTLKMLETIDKENDMDGKTPDIFKLMLDDIFGKLVDTPSYTDTRVINTFTVSNHGDKGLNGARSLNGMPNKMTTKMIVGHAHTASRIDGLLTVGTSSNLDRNYTFGLSTWSHTHAIIHANNKAQLIMQDSTTGNYKLDDTTSVGTFFKKSKGTTGKPYFTDESLSDDGFKYKILDSEGEIVGYFKGYRGVGDVVFEGSEWKGRKLIEDGSHHGYSVKYLND